MALIASVIKLLKESRKDLLSLLKGEVIDMLYTYLNK